MIISRELKKVEYEYNTDSQELTIKTVDPITRATTGKIIVDKVYMFSIFTFIKQIAYRGFIKKGQMKQLDKIKRERLAKKENAGTTQAARGNIA